MRDLGVVRVKSIVRLTDRCQPDCFYFFFVSIKPAHRAVKGATLTSPKEPTRNGLSQQKLISDDNDSDEAILEYLIRDYKSSDLQ